MKKLSLFKIYFSLLIIVHSSCAVAMEGQHGLDRRKTTTVFLSRQDCQDAIMRMMHANNNHALRYPQYARLTNFMYEQHQWQQDLINPDMEFKGLTCSSCDGSCEWNVLSLLGYLTLFNFDDDDMRKNFVTDLVQLCKDPNQGGTVTRDSTQTTYPLMELVLKLQDTVPDDLMTALLKHKNFNPNAMKIVEERFDDHREYRQFSLFNLALERLHTGLMENLLDFNVDIRKGVLILDKSADMSTMRSIPPLSTLVILSLLHALQQTASDEQKDEIQALMALLDDVLFEHGVDIKNRVEKLQDTDAQALENVLHYFLRHEEGNTDAWTLLCDQFCSETELIKVFRSPLWYFPFLEQFLQKEDKVLEEITSKLDAVMGDIVFVKLLKEGLPLVLKYKQTLLNIILEYKKVLLQEAFDGQSMFVIEYCSGEKDSILDIRFTHCYTYDACAAIADFYCNPSSYDWDLIQKDIDQWLCAKNPIDQMLALQSLMCLGLPSTTESVEDGGDSAGV